MLAARPEAEPDAVLQRQIDIGQRTRRCRKIGVGERKAERPVIASANRGGGGASGESFVGTAREGEAGGTGGVETATLNAQDRPRSVLNRRSQVEVGREECIGLGNRG